MVSSARNVRYWEGNERITLGSWQLKEKKLLVITIARRLNQNALTIADEVHQVGGDYLADHADDLITTWCCSWLLDAVRCC